jgi:hypothetical protein
MKLKNSLKVSLVCFLMLWLIAMPSQINAQNQNWVTMDKALIDKLIDAYKNDSVDITPFYNHKNTWTEETDLGFGYKTVMQRIPGGYVSISTTFLYYNDSLIAYKLVPCMPSDTALWPQYKAWYSTIFAFKDTFTALPKYHGYEQWIKPLTEYKGPLRIENQSALFQEYFSIESGNIWGCDDGWGGYHTNCGLYMELFPEFTPENVQFLMYSKNSITRLSAFFYYLTNTEKFSNHIEIEKWMQKTLLHHPRIWRAHWDVISSTEAEEELCLAVQQSLDNK